MGLIKGIAVTLYDKVQSGIDGFNKPTYDETPVLVPDVLVYPASSDDVVNELQLSGKRIVYELCIPKGDDHIWEDRRVDFFGNSYRTVGYCKEYIEDNLPLMWNKQIKVERYG